MFHVSNAKTNRCLLCGKSFWGVPDETCVPCEAILRAWAARGFTEICHYLEKVTKFEHFCAQRESSHDPAPAADE